MTATTKSKPLTYDHLKSLKAPRRKTVSLVGSDEAFEEVQNLQNLLEDATDQDARESLQRSLKTAQKTLEDSTVRITVQSIGRKRYEALVAEHPSTPEQDKESEEATGQPAPYNTDTFPPALLAASAVEPALTLEQAQEIWDDWNTGELMELFFATVEVNTMRRTDLGKGSGALSA